MKYMHTNILSKDWRKLADFYINVFDCKPTGRETNLFGDWLNKATDIENANLNGIQLTLPGYEKDGPTLEIFQYTKNLEKLNPIVANREGYGHIAFQVDDVKLVLEKLISHAGIKLGEIGKKEFKTGTLTCVYAKDPEGNIIELMNWTKK